MERTFLCSCCGGRYHLPLLRHVGEAEICERCENTETIICSRCGEVIWRRDNAGDESTPLCRNCFGLH